MTPSLILITAGAAMLAVWVVAYALVTRPRRTNRIYRDNCLN